MIQEVTMNKRKKDNSAMKLRRSIILYLCVLIFACYAFGCGGGVMPYVPSEYVPVKGQTASGSSKGQFFLLINKGVTTDMFDVKQLQPVFRNIVLSGNERKDRSGKKEERSTPDDSLKVTKEEKKKEKESIPVLNLHRLH